MSLFVTNAETNGPHTLGVKTASWRVVVMKRFTKSPSRLPISKEEVEAPLLKANVKPCIGPRDCNNNVDRARGFFLCQGCRDNIKKSGVYYEQPHLVHRPTAYKKNV